ncbi:MAG: hypothetical protein U0167_02750 [bacterium]
MSRNTALRTGGVAWLLQMAMVVGALGDEGTGRVAIARWLFDGSASDEMGGHPITLYGGATFAPACGSQGLFTGDPASYGTYPPIGEMTTGTISFQFELGAAFGADGTNPDPVIIINSNRVGHLVGDFSIRLEPTDGKLWFVQEDPFVSPAWSLKSARDSWQPGVCHRVEIQWNESGRVMQIMSPGYFERRQDAFAHPAFATDATLTTVLADAPPAGITLDWLEVACACPPLATEPTGWGLVKASYR